MPTAQRGISTRRGCASAQGRASAREPQSAGAPGCAPCPFRCHSGMDAGNKIVQASRWRSDLSPRTKVAAAAWPRGPRPAPARNRRRSCHSAEMGLSGAAGPGPPALSGAGQKGADALGGLGRGPACSCWRHPQTQALFTGGHGPSGRVRYRRAGAAGRQSFTASKDLQSAFVGGLTCPGRRGARGTFFPSLCVRTVATENVHPPHPPSPQGTSRAQPHLRELSSEGP